MPEEAVDLVVYATIRTGRSKDSYDKEMVVTLINTAGVTEDKRKLYYASYDQASLSYNSDNMIFTCQKHLTALKLFFQIVQVEIIQLQFKSLVIIFCLAHLMSEVCSRNWK